MSKDLHELTSAEITRQIAAHSDRRNAILAERAALFAERKRHDGVPNPPPAVPTVSDDERAARDQARAMLNGSSPAFLKTVPTGISRDQELSREQRAIDIVLDVLNDKRVGARAVEAVAWAEQHGHEWRKLCREIVLTATKLAAMEAAAHALLAQCPDIFAVDLPMTTLISGVEKRAVSEIPLHELQELAVAENIVTRSEIRKAAS
jgi:hypothetical protein